MRLLLMLIIGALAVSDTFSIGMSLAPGVSVKNALIYPIALGLVFRMALTGGFRMRLPIANIAFVIWISYATLTFLAIVTVIHYPGYDPRAMGISLKSLLFDAAIFFFVFFYGVETDKDFLLLTKTLALAVGLANIVTLADVAGIVHLGMVFGSQGVETGRVFGVFGTSNDTGGLIVCLLPMMVAAVATSNGGLARVFWYTCAIASVVVLMLTVSRGSYLAAALGYGWALWLCRRYLPSSRVMVWLLIGLSSVVVAAGLAAALWPQFIQTFTDRLFNQSMAVSASVVSSGRTSLWRENLDLMMAHPITFLTGYGWRVHSLMFSLETHNYYLDQWFGLGLIGLFAFVTILYQTIVTGLRAVATDDEHLRPYMIAFVFGMLAFAISIFFGNFDRPWAYVWIYVGLTARAAADMVEQAQRPSARAARLMPKPSGNSAAERARAARPPLVGDVRR